MNAPDVITLHDAGCVECEHAVTEALALLSATGSVSVTATVHEAGGGEHMATAIRSGRCDTTFPPVH